MAHLQDDGGYGADEYMVVDFEDDAEDQLQAARDRNSLDSDSDDEIDLVSRFRALSGFVPNSGDIGLVLAVIRPPAVGTE